MFEGLYGGNSFQKSVRTVGIIMFGRLYGGNGFLKVVPRVGIVKTWGLYGVPTKEEDGNNPLG